MSRYGSLLNFLESLKDYGNHYNLPDYGLPDSI
jgi:hypothetical protein